MKHLLRVTLILFFPIAAFAQLPNMDNYTPARSGGILPNDFLISTAQKYEMDRLKIDSSDEKMAKAESEFYLSNNYSIDELRFSGQVLVNDTLGAYVNRVADSLLLCQDPALRGQIKFYVLRSSAVNAFTTDQGVIFVTVGLLTRLHNESELAYVLAHEVIHYKRKHVLVGYQEGVKAQQGIGQYEATTFENRFLKKHRYARGQESQADEEGFELLVNSNYDPHAAITAFDILALADAPFSDTAFSKTFFESDYLVFPSKFQPDTVRPIKPQNEDEDDDLATHPSVYKRRKAIMHKFAKLDPKDTTGTLFLNEISMFNKVKVMARFEEAEEHLNDQEFDMAIYSAYADQRLYPKNHYLTREMIRALYSEVIKKNREYDFSDWASLFASMYTFNASDDRIIGEQGRMTAFMNKTDATGWNVLALNYAWKAHIQFPDDQDITNWCYGIARELAVKNEVKLKDFMVSDSAFIAIGNKAIEDTAVAHKVKLNTPAGRFQAAIDHLDRDSLDDYHYWQFAFVNEMKDSSFVQMYRWANNYADSLTLSDSLWDEKSSREQRKIHKEREDAFVGPQGLTKIVAVNPMYVAYSDEFQNSDMDVMRSLKGKDALLDEMKNDAALCGMNIQFLDASVMDSGSVSKLNDILVASEWFDHRSDYGDNQILPYPMEDMRKMADKYGTDYFMWSAYVTSKNKRSGKVFTILQMAFPPFAPNAIYKLFSKRQDVQFIAIVYNVRTGKPVYVQQTSMANQQDNRSRMKLTILDFMRILAAPKKGDNK